MAYFPFMIDIKNQHCLVVGGGNIAYHKVKLLSDFDVHIKVVGTEICQELRQLEKEKRVIENEEENPDEKQKEKLELDIEQREFQDSDIDGIDFVVAATDDEELNNYISDMCRQRKILVNVVDRKEVCSFIFPALLQDKDMLIAVSSGGYCPAAAGYVKRQIKKRIPGYYGDVVETLSGHRSYILNHVDSAKDRKDVFYRLFEYGDSHEGDIPWEIVKQVVAEVAEEKCVLQTATPNHLSA